LTVQQELAHGLIAELGYVGSQTRKNTILSDANPFILGRDDLQRFDTQTGGGVGNFSYLYEFKNAVNGNYNGLTTSLTKQPSEMRWFGSSFFQLSWTWSHALNNGEGFREYNAIVPAYNWRQFYASSDNDIRHRVAFSGGWGVPFGKGSRNALMKYAIAGWWIYPIVTFRTGYPLDIASGRSPDEGIPGPSGAGDPDQVRPNLVGSRVTTFDPHQPQKLNNATGNFYFDPTQFKYPDIVPGRYTYGTLGRNSFRGPNRANVDMAITKKFPLWGEGPNLEFRGEAFNLFNHTQFRDPNLNMQTGTFGQISTTEDPRILQLALRFQF
jgi:hypothetical protein